MAVENLITSWLDKIPYLIGIVRDLIEKGLDLVNLSGVSFIVFGVIAIFLAYLFLKQFIVSGWTKLSTLLNLILLTLIFYLLITRVT